MTLALWSETGELNKVIEEASRNGLGLGEAVGESIANSAFPYRDLSLAAAAWRENIPLTVHVGIGYDIIHEHPNCNGAALGDTSYRDFLIFASTIERLEGGVLLSFGSAIMAPEVYLKALAMARNVARQEGRSITDFTTAVFDIVPIAGEFRTSCQSPILATISARTRPYWYAQWRMAGKAFTSAGIIARPFRLYTGP